MWRRRAAGPKLTNTDGHRLRLITARVAVNDPAAVAARLAAHTDFRTEVAGELSWWGRELTEIEREGALAQMRSLADDGEVIQEPRRAIAHPSTVVTASSCHRSRETPTRVLVRREPHRPT